MWKNIRNLLSMKSEAIQVDFHFFRLVCCFKQLRTVQNRSGFECLWGSNVDNHLSQLSSFRCLRQTRRFMFPPQDLYYSVKDSRIFGNTLQINIITQGYVRQATSLILRHWYRSCDVVSSLDTTHKHNILLAICVHMHVC